MKFISDPDGAIAKVIKEAEEVWKPFITPEVRLVFLNKLIIMLDFLNSMNLSLKFLFSLISASN